MRPNRHWLHSTALAGLVLYGGTIALAQQPERKPTDAPRRPNQPAQADQADDKNQPGRAERKPQREVGREAQASTADSAFAACLIIDNNKEIALAQFAQQHAQNEKVKAFAEKMVSDHQAFVQKLQDTASAGGYTEQQLTLDGSPTSDRRQARAERDAAATDTDRPQPRTERPATGRRAARPAELDNTAGGQGVDFIALHQEMAEQCLQSAQRGLQEGDAAEFDKHYIGAQIMAHQGMVDMLTVITRHASPELQLTLQAGRQTAQAHLDEARQIKQQLMASATAERPSN